MILISFLLSSCVVPITPGIGITPTTPPAATATQTKLPTDTGITPTFTLISPTDTSTPMNVVASPTIIIPSPTPYFTETPMPTLAPTPVPPTVGGEIIYAIQPGTPVALSGFPHPELGCNWMGVGGQVFASTANPVINLVVQLSGKIGGQDVNILGVTGSATIWGEGGYELKIADHPIESSGTLWLQFYNLSGNPVSDRIYLTTYNDCARNSILLNLIQFRDSNPYRTYLPDIKK